MATFTNKPFWVRLNICPYDCDIRRVYNFEYIYHIFICNKRNKLVYFYADMFVKSVPEREKDTYFYKHMYDFNEENKHF